MKHRQIAVFCCLIGSLIAAAAFYLSGENDPVYQGKRLSHYLYTFGRCGFTHYSLEEPATPSIQVDNLDPAAWEAFRAVGTNGLPLLIRELKSKDTRLGLWLCQMDSKYPKIQKWLPHKFRSAGVRQLAAVAALYRLGSQAAPAIPKIIPLMRDPELALPSMFAILAIRPEREQDILSLTNILGIQKSAPNRPNSLEQEKAVGLLILATFGDKAKGAIPVLIETLGTTNVLLRAAAATALVRIGTSRGTLAPLILKNLPVANPAKYDPMSLSQHIQDRAILMNLWALGQCGRYARGALPLLSNLQQYPLKNVADAARASALLIEAEIQAQSQ